MKKQAGMSLSEVLVSLFLSALISTLLIQFYLSSKRQYLEAEKILALEFDVQRVSALLSDSIRRAGFTPCLGIEQLRLSDGKGQLLQGIEIKNQLGQSLRVNRMHEDFTQVVRVLHSGQVIVADSASLRAQHPVLIADCEHAEIKRIASIEHHPEGSVLALEQPLQFTYDTSAYVGEWISERWFIKKNTAGQPGFYYQLRRVEEMTPLIQSFNVQQEWLQGRRLIKIRMGLADGTTRQLAAAVRGS